MRDFFVGGTTTPFVVQREMLKNLLQEWEKGKIWVSCEDCIPGSPVLLVGCASSLCERTDQLKYKVMY